MIDKETGELKPEQELAAYTLDRHVSVTAGPGAGKTTVLVERYLHILRSHDVSVDQIVAITFTNRAANQMRERLRRELDKLLWSAGPEERARWMRHKRTLESAIITTIHGFCARLLREFPVAAEIDPQFSLLDAHQSAMLEEAVAEESLTEFISAGHPAITALTAGIGRVRLARGLIGVYRSMRNQGVALDSLQAGTERSHKTIEEFFVTLNRLSAKMNEFIGTRGLSDLAEEKRRQAESRWPALRERLFAVSASTPPAEYCSAIEEFRAHTRPDARGKLAELVKELNLLIWEKNLGGLVPRTLLDLHARPYSQEIIKLVGIIERRLDQEKRRRSALDFDDLQVRALKLLEDHPEVLRRTAGRYRFFLVDEFQDTNSLQRDLMTTLALGNRRSNLFIVGDRKQSIYGFRGANVDVFREISGLIEAENGLTVPLNRNFRSQRPLIRFFNFLFGRIFEPGDAFAMVDELNELGYVEHEPSVAAREDEDPPPLVELLVDFRENDDDQDVSSRQTARERDAKQLAERIASLAGSESISAARSSDHSARPRKLEYRDIALLFRAMTEVHIYESAFRRAGIPYVTVDGKGFYAREEITDFIQLLRFLDNKTDEVALAAVLRSPICGLSDDTLFALRCAPVRPGVDERQRFQSRRGVRSLFSALRDHEFITLIDDDDRREIDRSRALMNELIGRAKRAGISELLRFAADATDYRIIAAATFDGAQRLANIEKLFTLAERFERSGSYLIRDFVRFVQDFEDAGGRESEGQTDESADAVRLMSIHQSKGLEFPVVIIPDLHRLPDNRRDWWALDRHRGLTVKVPDGRGRLAAGSAFAEFTERAKKREDFESMRLLYVAATRARDRLILSGAAKDLSSVGRSWLGWITGAIQAGKEAESRMLNPAEGVQVRFTVNLLGAATRGSTRFPDLSPRRPEQDSVQAPPHGLPAAGDEDFPLLKRIEPQRATGLYRFSVTQLLNYSRCPRQYYFDRVLHTPSEDQLAVWNDADAPEPPANLTATLKGAVIHRFCERFRDGDDMQESLKTSFEEVLRQRTAELADRLLEIDSGKAVRDLLPLARNYVESRVRQRVESVRSIPSGSRITHESPIGVFSEQRFRLRRPLGILTGTIDKLIVSPASSGNGLNVEIVDFKTNRFRGRKAGAGGTEQSAVDREQYSGTRRKTDAGQLSFTFLKPAFATPSNRDLLLQAEVQGAAADYQLQMQAYALAALELIPGVASVRVTLHFLDPDVEVSLPDALVKRDVCARDLDKAMLGLVSSTAPEMFPAHPADHCLMCNFRELCPPGRQWTR